MAEGLRAAFGSEPELQRPSVRRRLQKKTGSQLDLHLHDHSDESDAPVRIDDDAKAMRDPSGRYQVLGEIGRGGVGVVYKGRDQDLGRDVAMKVLRPEHVSRPEIVERFIEEAQIGGQLQHPGIVPVYEIGLQAGERPYFAMKLVKGQTLAELLAQRKSPDEERRRFLGCFEQVCQTIAYAHARRVVHRDLKPNNVMIGSFGEVQVVDWGFAKVLPLATLEGPAPSKAPSMASVISTVRSDPKTGSHSVVGSMMGTPAYMPPEQANGDVEHMDQRSDVFGLGAMLCEILTGKPPYLAADGDLIQQAARAHLQGAYERLEKCGADAVLIALCRQCLSPARQARPDSAKQVAEAVAHYLTSVEERARDAQIHAAEAKVRARATVLLSVAAVLLLAVGGGCYLWLQRERQSRREQASQRVGIALNEANVRLGEARAKEPPELALWARAADAANQAGQLAGETDVGSEQRSHASALLATVHGDQSKAIAAAARLEKDAAMQQRLLDVRSQRLDANGADYMVQEHRRRERGFAAAFDRYLDGRDVTTMSRDDAVQALAGPIAVDLAAGLDTWCSSRRYLGRNDRKSPPDPEATSRLGDLASAIDPDPWRVRLRTMLAADDRDRDAIVALYRDADLDAFPVLSLLLLAGALYDVGDLPASQAVNERGCERFPADFSCAFQLGLLHLNSGRCAPAESWFRVAHALRPDRLENLHHLGKALDGQGDHVEEEQLFRQLEEREPGNAHWTHHVGLALMAQGRLDEAVATYRRAIELDPRQTLSFISLSSAFMRLGRFDDAVAACRRALEIDPQCADACTNLGNSLEQLGELDDAIASYRRAIELAPKSGGAHYNLGNFLKEQGRFAEALPILQHAIAIEPGFARSHGCLGSVLAELGRPDEAIACYQRAIELEPKAAGYHYNLANVLAMANRSDEAVASFRRAIELEPTDARSHMNLGNLLLNRGELDEAIASHRRAAAIWGARSDAYAVEWREKALRAVASDELRIAHRDRLLAVLRGASDAKDSAEWYEAGNLGLARGDHQLAVVAYRRAIERDPTSAILHCNMGVAFERLARLDDAVASFERAIELEPKQALFHVNLANALQLQGNLEDAVGCYREALEIDPTHVAGWLALGKAFREMGEMDESLACARKGAELAPTLPLAVNSLGFTLHEAGRTAESIDCFRKVVALAPSAVNHHNLGAALVRCARPAEAIASYRRAAELDPGNAQFHLDLALALQQAGKHDEAEGFFRRCVELDPTLAMGHYNLAWYLQDEKQWDEAIDHYRKTIANLPDHAEAHCNLAMCLQNTGQFAEALTFVRRGHELGSKRAGWPYPSAEWVRTAEQRAALDEKLPSLLAGVIAPDDEAERLEFTTMCGVKGLHHAAVRLTQEAFAANPALADDLAARHRFNGALSAAMAGTGRSKDSAPLDEPERARLRRLALDWLRADLEVHRRRLERGTPDERAAVVARLGEWQKEPDLDCIRKAAALAALPPAERIAFGNLWAEVAELLRSK